MRNFFQHVKTRVIAGVIFLIPVFVIIMIVQKLWKILSGSGHYLANTLGFKPIFGNSSAQIATGLLLALLFYFFGWLVRFSILNRWRDWIENALLQYIPGYLTYRAQLQEKISPTEDPRQPVLIDTLTGQRPGLLIEELQNEMIVFFPNSPDTNNGEVLFVDKIKVTKLDIKAPAFMKNMQKFGKGLKN